MCGERCGDLPVGCQLLRGHEGEHRWFGPVEIDYFTEEQYAEEGHLAQGNPISLPPEYVSRLVREGRIRPR